jgi:hypothetical protein
MDRRVVGVLLLVVICVVAAGFLFGRVPTAGSHGDANTSTESTVAPAGDLMAVAAVLKSYKAVAGKYPASEQDLVPTYLPQMPLGADGREYQYEVTSDASAFRLWANVARIFLHGRLMSVARGSVMWRQKKKPPQRGG